MVIKNVTINSYFSIKDHWGPFFCNGHFSFPLNKTISVWSFISFCHHMPLIETCHHHMPQPPSSCPCPLPLSPLSLNFSPSHIQVLLLSPQTLLLTIHGSPTCTPCALLLSISPCGLPADLTLSSSLFPPFCSLCS